MINLFSTHYCHVYYDCDTQVLYAEWMGSLSLEEVTEGCQVLYNFIKDHQIQYHLSDHRKLNVLSPTVQNFLVRSWFPAVEQLGLKKVAVVTSPNLFARVSVAVVNRDARLGNLQIVSFQTRQECDSWLEEGVAELVSL